MRLEIANYGLLILRTKMASFVMLSHVSSCMNNIVFIDVQLSTEHFLVMMIILLTFQVKEHLFTTGVVSEWQWLPT